jgi:hypothetical protein
MNEVVLAQKASDWSRLKALVLDSVSSPIRKRVYNLGLNEFFDWVRPGTATGLHQSDRERLAGCPRGQRTRLDLDQRADHSGAETGSRGGRQRTAGAGIGCRDRPCKDRP